MFVVFVGRNVMMLTVRKYIGFNVTRVEFGINFHAITQMKNYSFVQIVFKLHDCQNYSELINISMTPTCILKGNQL